MFKRFLSCLFFDKIYKCNKCNNVFQNKYDFYKHLDYEKIQALRNELQKFNEKYINDNNIYIFDINTLGEYIYKEDQGGDIYIIQNDINMIDYYKVGITTNLIKRISVYRCGSVIEPKVCYYFPIKNIKLADNLLKSKLKKYVVKREIYKINKLEEIINIIHEIQKEFDSDILVYEPQIKLNKII